MGHKDRKGFFRGWSIEHGLQMLGLPGYLGPGEGGAGAEPWALWGLFLYLAAGASPAAARRAQSVSWLVGWPTVVLCAEFLSKEEEEMPAIPYIILCHLPRRRDTAVGKTAFTHAFVLGPEREPGAVGFG